MKLALHRVLLSFFFAVATSSVASASITTFQAYIVGGTAGDRGLDVDTWFTSDTSFDLTVVGGYTVNGEETTSLTNVTLVVSVPDGESGTISIVGGNGANLLTTITPLGGTAIGYSNPAANADIGILTNVGGLHGYSDKSFLPDGDFNNHFPFTAEVSDFLVFGLGDYDDVEQIHNYDADDGTTNLLAGSHGEEMTYAISITGFTRAHFDVYGFEDTYNGVSIQSEWEINPATNDSTFDFTFVIPEPTTFIVWSLLGLTAGVISYRRNSKA